MIGFDEALTVFCKHDYDLIHLYCLAGALVGLIPLSKVTSHMTDRLERHLIRVVYSLKK